MIFFNSTTFKIILITFQWLTGFLLFSSRKLLKKKKYRLKNKKISVIIPARNEEHNLSFLLESLKNQTIEPDEIIVVDDNSKDKTKEIALKYKTKLITNTEPPENWTGKSWALWNGYLHSTGDIFIFIDSDVRLSKDAISTLLYMQEKVKGVISVFPYHYTEKFYEKLSIIFNFLGSLTFASPFEKILKRGDMCGAVIVVKREDYEKIGGHRSVSSDVVEDFAIGKEFERKGIPTETYLGHKIVSFRMYPDGIKKLIEGFTKNTAKGAVSISFITFILLLFWFSGLFGTGLSLVLSVLQKNLQINYNTIFYLLYVIQLLLVGRYVGNFGIVLPVLHFIPSTFFILVFINSIYRYFIKGEISWKEREIFINKRIIK